ncbi:hypothetical protein EJB05_15461 [Eragrostis curvula]|uniref:Uncharacterized protein n=1 Tax=Eragrostis curvula TaxID=38414 RepID=A0A5J9VZL8_9POAL|nr:hypothetical protein EJB05_15461 [Eragrostis curvula]
MVPRAWRPGSSWNAAGSGRRPLAPWRQAAHLREEEELHADYLPWFHSFELLSFCRSQEISRACVLGLGATRPSMVLLVIAKMDLVCGGTSAFCYQ